MITVVAITMVFAALFFTLSVREKDIPEPVPGSPVQHLEDRKQAIYENLRDLQFEYRLGKLSDEDYQQTKIALQKELAGVLAEREEIVKRLGMAPDRVPSKPVAARGAAAPSSSPVVGSGSLCPHCGAVFSQVLRFCGHCGKAIA